MPNSVPGGGGRVVQFPTVLLWGGLGLRDTQALIGSL